mmetsp:Transcript_96041/g.244017  ORF Transcript_96041/g.244017 Transcript_96041/m.244017 type:complete len:98 (+) Transcript_96041:267-560(+)
MGPKPFVQSSRPTESVAGRHVDWIRRAGTGFYRRWTQEAGKKVSDIGKQVSDISKEATAPNRNSKPGPVGKAVSDVGTQKSKDKDVSKSKVKVVPRC